MVKKFRSLSCEKVKVVRKIIELSRSSWVDQTSWIRAVIADAETHVSSKLKPSLDWPNANCLPTLDFLSLAQVAQLNFATSSSYPPDLPPNIPKITNTGVGVNQRLTQSREPNQRHRFDFLFAQEKPPHVITHSLVTLPFGPSFLYKPSHHHSLSHNQLTKPSSSSSDKKSQLSLLCSTIMGNFHSSYYFHLLFFS